MADFAERLNTLFAAYLQPATGPGRRREEYSNSAVARVANNLMPEGEKPILTRQYLGMLRSGERREPSLRAANAIANAFAVLSERSGSPTDHGSLLAFLAGDHGTGGDDGGSTAPEPTAPEPTSAEQPPDRDRGVPTMARLGENLDDPESLAAIRTMIDQLSREDAEPMRRKLARLLGIRG